MSIATRAVCASLEDLADETWMLMSYGLARTAMRAPDERTFTDHHFLHLERRHRPLVAMHLFDQSEEALTGADAEWWIGDGRRYARLLVQAKRIDRGARYTSLGREIRGTGVRQLDRLVDTCEQPSSPYFGCLPVCLFYNGHRERLDDALDRCENPAVGRTQRGCTIAYAWPVLAALQNVRRPNARSLRWDQVAPFMLPWRCLFCCPLRQHLSVPNRVVDGLLGGPGAPGPPSPPRGQRPRPGSGGRGGARGDRTRAEIRIWDRRDLPVDPAELSEVGAVRASTADGWRPAARWVVVMTLPQEGAEQE